MRYASTATGTFPTSREQEVIALFLKNGESGPHSSSGLLLYAVCNHCVANDIPFTLVFVPKAGYYIRKDYPDGFMTERAVGILKKELEWRADSTGEPVDENIFGMLYDLRVRKESK